VQLCEMDSDGDGRSNGVELGDPDCVWVAGGPNPTGPAVSHPGIVDEPKSSAVTGTCNTFVAPVDEIVMNISFSAPISIDETQTHYICEQRELDVPAQQALDKIKDEIILDNYAILHHMFIYWCQDGAVSSDGDKVGNGYYTCSGVEAGCSRIAGWAIGQDATCLPENVGFRMDFSNSTKFTVKIEAHYDNTSGQAQQDQSGIRLHLTPTLRPLRGFTSILGMATVNKDFEIPPLEPNYNLTNICPTALTELLPQPLFVFAFMPHMHKYGRQLVTEHYRCGEKIGEIGRIDQYEFNNQQTYALDTPIKILPGDALVTTCTYDTTSSNVTIDGGEATTNEMCLNFLSVYPYVGTEVNPTFFGACMSFEHGIQTAERDIDLRFAVAGKDMQAVTREFESDPLQSNTSCCGNSSCEELYLASDGGACAVDTDCLGEMSVCAGGLCDDASFTGAAPTASPLGVTFSPTASSGTSTSKPPRIIARLVGLLIWWRRH
jgi:dopamine beta-monooxygenase